MSSTQSHFCWPPCDPSPKFLLLFLFVLHGIGEHLVHLGDLAGHAQIDGAFADFDHETAEDIWVDMRHGLELLALAVFGLGDGCFETLE